MAPTRPSDLTNYFIYLLFVATIGTLLFGYHLAELNAPQDVLTCKKKSIAIATTESTMPGCIPMNTPQFSLVSSIYTLGGLFGALFAGPPSTKYGRLWTMRYTTFFFIAGPIAKAAAPNIALLAFGRFVSGIGAGAALVVVPIYLSEISPPGRKGFFGSFTQVSVNLGILIAQLLGYFLSRPQLWRVILGVGGIIGLSQFFGLFFVVESPKWQAAHGMPVEAKLGLQSIRGHANNVREMEAWGINSADSEGAEENEGLINNFGQPPGSHVGTDVSISQVPKDTHIGFFGALLWPQYRRAVFIVVLVMVAQQFTGINSIMMYGVSLLSDLLSQSSALLNVCLAAMNLIMASACVPLPDRFGRKPCLLVSICGMGVCSLLLAIAIMNSIPILAAVAVLAFVASFCLGLGPVPYILASELVGPEAVGATLGWALMANWTSTFIIAQFFPILNQAMGKGKVFLVFAVLAVVFAVSVASFVPETKDAKPLDEERATI